MPTMFTMLRRLLPVAILLTLGIPGVYAQLDCGNPVDVKLTPSANVTFKGTSGETVYIRLLANSVDPGFTLNQPVVADPFGNVFNARPRNQSRPVTPGATPVDLAGGVYARKLQRVGIRSQYRRHVYPATGWHQPWRQRQPPRCPDANQPPLRR